MRPTGGRRALARMTTGLLGLAMVGSLLVAAPAQADPGAGAPDQPRPHHQIARSPAAAGSADGRASGKTGTGTTTEATVTPAASDTANALALANRYRAQVGLKGLYYDTKLDAALRAHANYIQINQMSSNFDPYSENPALPGYTQAGADIAPFVSATTQSASYTAALDLLMMDPWERTGRFLDPNAQGIAVTRTTDYTVFAFSWTTSATTPVVSFPQGAGFGKLAFESSIAPYYTGMCPQQSTAWGYPISVQFDHTQYDRLTSVTSSLRRDGVPVSYCLLWQPDQTAMRAIAVLIPTAPLVQGSHYTGHVTATGVRDNGTTGPAVTEQIGFTTTAPATTIPGDQTGDRVGDLVAIDPTGGLKLYKGVRPLRLGYGWVIGQGWGSTNWLSHTRDINGDGHEDLLARRSDGSLWLYAGLGMGAYATGKQVGRGWGGLRELTVLNNMTSSGSVDVVGILGDGTLMRYTLTSTGMANATKIGQGWGGMVQLTTVGDFNGDGTPDIIAVRADGLLYAYYTRAGAVSGSATVGRGWGGFTALFSPGDLTGDGRADLVGRNAINELISFENKVGAWGAATKAGQGWGGFTAFA